MAEEEPEAEEVAAADRVYEETWLIRLLLLRSIMAGLSAT